MWKCKTKWIIVLIVTCLRCAEIQYLREDRLPGCGRCMELGRWCRISSLGLVHKVVDTVRLSMGVVLGGVR